MFTRSFVFIFIFLLFAVAVQCAPPEALRLLLDSPLAHYANGTWLIEAEDIFPAEATDRPGPADEFLSKEIHLTKGQYHFRIRLRAPEDSTEIPEGGEFIVESIEGEEIASKAISPEMFKQPGRWGRMDLDVALDEGEFRIALQFDKLVALELDNLSISPRFTSNIFPLPSTEWAQSHGQTTSEMERLEIDLGGLWQLQPAREDLLFYPSPDEWEATPIRIPSPWNVNRFNKVPGGPDCVFYPSYPERWESLDAVWLKREFVSPEVDKDCWRLTFDAVMYSAEVYLNGRHIGFHEGGFEPFAFDVSEALIPGETNVLLVGVRSWKPYTVEGGGRPFPWGSFWGMTISGIWQDVRLETGGVIETTDVQIIPMDKPRRLRAIYEFVNATGEEASVICESRIVGTSDANAPVVPLVPFEQSIPARGVASATVEIPWENARLWEPDDPFLYSLETSLSDPEGTVDSRSDRFGFRIFESEEGRIYLNGKRTKLRGDAWHFPGIPALHPEYPGSWYRLCKESHVNTVRLHAQMYPRKFVTTADEMGMMLIDESSHWASGLLGWYSEDFHARMRQHLTSLVRRDRNSPSVIAWSVANELRAGYGSWPHCNVESLDRLEDDFSSLLDLVRRLDPTRPVYCDGDYDLGGHADWFSFHYPGTPRIDEDKPVTIGESSSLYYGSPLDLAPTGGEDVFSSWEARCRAAAEEFYLRAIHYRQWAELLTPFNIVWYCMQPLRFDSPRLSDMHGPERYGPYCATLNFGVDADLPEYKPNPAYPTIKDCLRPIQLFPLEQDAHFYGGKFLVRRFNLHNDEREDRSLNIEFGYDTNDGTVLREGKRGLTIPAGEFRVVSFTAPLPEVEERTELKLAIEITGGKQPPLEKTFDYDIHPEPENPLPTYKQSTQKTAFVGNIPEELARLTGPAEQVEDWAALAGDKAWRDAVVIVGNDTGLEAEQIQLLREAVRENGLRAVVPGYCFPLTEKDGFLQSWRGAFERVFPAFGSHAVTDGLSSDMLRAWSPDGIVADRSFKGWAGKCARPLVYSGAGDAVLVEVADGRGMYLFSGMRLLPSLGRNPVADLLCARMLKHAKNFLPRQTRKVFCIDDSGGPVSGALESLGVEYSLFDPMALEDESLMIANGNYSGLFEGSDLAQNVQRYLDREGILFLWNISPDNLLSIQRQASSDGTDWLKAIGELELIPVDVQQAVRSESANDTVAGIHHADLYQLEMNGPPLVRFAVNPGEGIHNLLSMPSFDWRRWVIPWRSEPYHLGSVYRAMEEGLPEGAVLCALENESIFLYQIPTSRMNDKSARVLGRILGNLGAPFRRSAASREALSVDSEGYIRDWWVMGPFEGGSMTEVANRDFLVEQGGEAFARPSEVKGWRKYSSEQPAIQIAEIPGVGYRENAVVYFGTYVYSPRPYGEILDSPDALNLRLLLGSDDGAVVWLDGKEIFRDHSPRPHRPDQNRIGPIHLKAGWNPLIVKVLQYSHTWEMSARFALEGRSGKTDLIISLVPE